ncbi:T-cell-specific guanine nucleotide triphosphate-binding protein 2-like [Mya arenaria]|uniref:T-cell-specific guanine nucleotide triphosphate-binding protein 2-like n=1 Tax=Mya arenaria TaxID=6604 RepID=UPI0022E29359|nr:T-cell-specific guanine nucleotide triphosphate-binding protein 2-like [Mya arenaria]
MEVGKEESLISDIREYAKTFTENGVSSFQNKIEQNLNVWKEKKLNIAVVGDSGAGKSSLINAILGLTAEDEGAAPVGSMETTMTIEKYVNPLHPNLVFSDMPGIGTPNFPRDSYFAKIGQDLTEFDFFLIVCSGRFKENDLWFANIIHSQRKEFYFVRTHTDEDVLSNKHDFPQTHNQETLLALLKNRLFDELNRAQIATNQDHIFLVDNYDPTKYDFEKLLDTLVVNAPSIKKDTLILSLAITTNNLIDEKVKVLKDRVYIKALLACVGSLVPLPGVGVAVEASVLYQEYQFYREQLSIDDKSMQNISERLDVSKENLEKKLNMKSHMVSVSLQAFVKFLSVHVASEGIENVVKAALPIISSVLAAGVSYPLCVHSLKNLLAMCEKEARAAHYDVEIMFLKQHQ